MSNEMIVHTLNDIQKTVARIEAQTVKTNGRTSKLENWQNFIMGGLAVITILMLPILFIVVNNYFER